MAGYKHTVRKGCVVAVEEATEGTYHTAGIAAVATAATIYEASYSTTPRLYERLPYKTDFSSLPALKGGTLGSITCKAELAGSGVSALTVPNWSPLLVACGWQQVAAANLEEITLGATGAGFIPGELLTSAAGETMTFVKYFLKVAAHTALVCDVSGVIGAENLTGAVSGNVVAATGDAIQSTYGVLHRPKSALASQSVSMVEPYNLDATTTAFQLKGARGSWKLGAGGVGEPIFADLEFMGVVADVAEVAAVARTYQHPIGLPFIGSNFFSMQNPDGPVGQAAANIKLSSFSIESNTEVSPDDSANDNGYLSQFYGGRNIKGSFDPALLEVGHADFWSDYDSDVQNVLSCPLGSVAGNILEIYAGNVRYQGYGAGSRGTIRTLDMPFGVHEVGSRPDTEVLILTR